MPAQNATILTAAASAMGTPGFNALGDATMRQAVMGPIGISPENAQMISTIMAPEPCDLHAEEDYDMIGADGLDFTLPLGPPSSVPSVIDGDEKPPMQLTNDNDLAPALTYQKLDKLDIATVRWVRLVEKFWLWLNMTRYRLASSKRDEVSDIQGLQPRTRYRGYRFRYC
jgi:hypothetical protein